MRRSQCLLIVTALTIGVFNIPTDTFAQDRPAQTGPPTWVVEAWQSGAEPVAPKNGPPAWVIEAWKSGERSQRRFGPPRWIAARHRRALELGLPGPPAEVISAWGNGEGKSFPGPPDFVLEILGF